MSQSITPVASTIPHPNLSAPAGTKRYTTESCTGPGGALPLVAYPIRGDRENGSIGEAPGTGVRVREVPAEVAAVDLAWWSTSPAPRLATDEEVAAYRATHP